jgi:pimeloyl-ACP methyl ester carboxylesterase
MAAPEVPPSPSCRSETVTTADGLRLHVACYGEPRPGARTVLCLPGLTRTGADFEPLARALAADPQLPRRVLALDYRGRGQSDYDPDPANYTVPVETGDVIGVLQAFDAAPAIIVGTSRGGLIAMVLAAVRPELIAGVVFNDIGPAIERDGLLRIKSYVGAIPGTMGAPRDYDEAAALLRGLFADQFPNLTAGDWRAAARRGFRADGDHLITTYDPALARGQDSLTPETPLPALWKEFDALQGKPLMVIRGALSDILSPATVGEMQRRRPDLETIEIADQGHPPLLREPDVIARIAAYARRCDVRAN